jgi:uncharacterized repeat protein (TIGR01451 family)
MLHKTVRITSVLLVVFALTLAVVTPGTVRAYDQDVGHGDIAQEAVKLVDNSELKNNSGAIIAGATSEDDVDHIYDLGATNRTCTHFWDVDGTHGHGPGGPYDQNKCLWPNGAYDCYANAFMKGITLYNKAVQTYQAGNPYQAYEYLGHVAHLLADASVPGHAHEDYWPNHDNYESWIKDHYFDVSGGRWTSAHASAAGGPVAIPSYIELQARINLLHMFEPTRIPDDMLSWDETRLSLYYLFYTSNQFGDYFNSPDVPGDSFEPYGWVGYGSFPSSRWPGEQVMGNYIFVYDIRVTAALYKLFLKSVGRLGGASPTTTATLSGTAGTDGWYTSDVVVTLNASDGAGGVKEITYFAAGAQTIPPTTASGNTASFTIEAEGATMVTYFAAGYEGPEELQNLLTVQINKTPLGLTSLEVKVNRAQAYAGSVLEYQLKVRNLTPAVQSFAVSDPIPANTEIVRRINYNPAANAVEWSGVVEPWGFKTFTVYVRIVSGTPGGTAIVNTATIEDEPGGGNASATTIVKMLPLYQGHRADVDVNEMVIGGN